MTTPTVEDRLLRGDTLHMQIRDGKRQFWFEHPFQPVSAEAFDRAAAAVDLMPAGDSLFGHPMNSQTWIAVQGGPH